MLRLFGVTEHHARAVLETVRPLLENGRLTEEDLKDAVLRSGSSSRSSGSGWIPMLPTWATFDRWKS
jgi:hypothetical protein